MLGKWEAIALIGCASAVFGALAVKNISADKVSVEMAKAGLEECPKEIGDYRTIWVKDCVAYRKTVKLEMEK